jgi:branched-chain amino acid aminotransferase
VIVVSELSPQPVGTYEHGIAAITFRAERPSDAPAVADAKIGNYLLAVLAARSARERGAREALLEDAQGRILEGATSNVFAVFGDQLRTPPESSPILPGITRARVITLARSAGIAVELRDSSKAELMRADEVFVCSSIREIVPVVSIDGQLVGSGAPGPITRELLRAYRAAASAG